MEDNRLLDLADKPTVKYLGDMAVLVLRRDIFPNLEPKERRQLVLELTKDYCDYCMELIPCSCTTHVY